MEELLELRGYIEGQQYPEALVLIEEMEEMSREDKVSKIRSFAKILLLHIVKQHAEKRSTRSWDVSIRNAIREINYVNYRRKAKGTYLDENGLKDALAEAYLTALDRASLEVFGGIYDEKQLGNMVVREEIEQEAFTLIQNYRSE
ncbi:DUF29 family protein [Anaerolineales bacterium HSG24]|nr:DUF29 family protein [Anaerolineales bacterium HSG24]